MANKKYSPELKEMYDELGRKIVKKWFKKNLPEFVLKDNVNEFGVDCKAYENGIHKFNVEIEVRPQKHWGLQNDTLNYPTVHCPLRKGKYKKEGKFIYVIVRVDGKRIGILKDAGKWFIEMYKCKVNTKYMDNEDFFDIPKKEWRFYEVFDVTN